MTYLIINMKNLWKEILKNQYFWFVSGQDTMKFMNRSRHEDGYDADDTRHAVLLLNLYCSFSLLGQEIV